MRTILADARRGHPGLFGMAVGMAGLTVVLAALAVLDPRELLGAPLWVKPLKFAISFVAYGFALAWMLGRLPQRALQRSGWVIVAASVIEMVIIAVQAGRGELSHYHTEGGIFAIMGATVAVLWVATAAIAVRFLRERTLPADLVLAVRLGLGVALVGMAVGVIMSSSGAHTVGAPDGGPGLPLVGWSTVAGDLRVAHFVGLHALQVLPLCAAALARFRPRWDVAVRRRVVAVAGLGQLGLVGLLTWQALRAQPVLAPDLRTLLALGALVGGVLGGVALATRGRGKGARSVDRRLPVAAPPVPPARPAVSVSAPPVPPAGPAVSAADRPVTTADSPVAEPGGAGPGPWPAGSPTDGRRPVEV